MYDKYKDLLDLLTEVEVSSMPYELKNKIRLKLFEINGLRDRVEAWANFSHFWYGPCDAYGPGGICGVCKDLHLKSGDEIVAGRKR